MQIQGIEECAVIVRLSPGDALLLADACRRAALDCGTQEESATKQTYDLAASHLEGLALIGQAQGLVRENRAFLEKWTLAQVREGWNMVGKGAAE
jgi:hypothetical protein